MQLLIDSHAARMVRHDGPRPMLLPAGHFVSRVLPSAGRGQYRAAVRRWRARGALVTSDPAGIPALIEAIRHLEGCAAEWVESVPVRQCGGAP
jgi:hypothetical protein